MQKYRKLGEFTSPVFQGIWVSNMRATQKNRKIPGRPFPLTIHLNAVKLAQYVPPLVGINGPLTEMAPCKA